MQLTFTYLPSGLNQDIIKPKCDPAFPDRPASIFPERKLIIIGTVRDYRNNRTTTRQNNVRFHAKWLE